MRPIRTAPLATPATRDRGDHWTTQASCTTDAGIWAMADAITFEKNPRIIAHAKTFCAGCPVATECLRDYDVLVPDGVIGGLTADERKILRNGNPKRSYYTAARNRGAA